MNDAKSFKNLAEKLIMFNQSDPTNNLEVGALRAVCLRLFDYFEYI